MARYFFNLHDGATLADTVGSDHPDLDSARHEAVEAMGERLKGSLLKKNDISSWLMNVTDEYGVTVIILSFTAAVQIIDVAVLGAARSAVL